MTSPSTPSKPLRERLMPQVSIRSFLIMIGGCALVMYVFRAAFVLDQMWAMIASLLIVTAGGCFLVYAVLFLIANLFTASTVPIQQALVGSKHGDGQPGATTLSQDSKDQQADRGSPPTVGGA